MRGFCHQCGSSPVALDRVDQRDLLGVAAGAVDHLVEPLVEVAAGAEDDVGLGERGGVAGARLVLVRVGVGPQDRVDRDALGPPTLRTRSATCVVVATAVDARVAAAPVVAAAARQRATSSEGDERAEAAHGRRSDTQMRMVLSCAPGGRRSQLARRARLPLRMDALELVALCVWCFVVACAGGALGLVLGNIRLPAVLLVASSPAAGAGANIGISGVAAFAAAVAHIRAGRINWRLFAWMAPPSMAGAVVGGLVSGAIPDTALLLVIGGDAALLRRRPAAPHAAAARGDGEATPRHPRRGGLGRADRPARRAGRPDPRLAAHARPAALGRRGARARGRHQPRRRVLGRRGRRGRAPPRRRRLDRARRRRRRLGARRPARRPPDRPAERAAAAARDRRDPAWSPAPRPRSRPCSSSSVQRAPMGRYSP